MPGFAPVPIQPTSDPTSPLSPTPSSPSALPHVRAKARGDEAVRQQKWSDAIYAYTEALSLFEPDSTVNSLALKGPTWPVKVRANRSFAYLMRARSPHDDDNDDDDHHHERSSVTTPTTTATMTVARSGLEDETRAEVDARRVMAEQPDWVRGYERLVAVLTDQGRWLEAAKVCRRGHVHLTRDSSLHDAPSSLKRISDSLIVRTARDEDVLGPTGKAKGDDRDLTHRLEHQHQRPRDLFGGRVLVVRAAKGQLVGLGLADEEDDDREKVTQDARAIPGTDTIPPRAPLVLPVITTRYVTH